MNRRQIMVGAVGLAGLAGPAGARGQEGTPIASPVASPIASPDAPSDALIGYGVPGLEETVSRSFETTRAAFVGPSLIFAGVYRFADDAAASVGLGYIQDGYVAELDENFDTSDLLPTAIGDDGSDQVLALSGELVTLAQDEALDTVAMAIIWSQADTLVRFVASVTLADDPMPYAIDVHAAMERRQPSDEPVSEDAFGLHAGGLWATLPTLADVPDGLRFEEDKGYP